MVIGSFFFGVPVLGSKIGGIPELIQEGINGMMFELYDEDDLANKLFFSDNISKWRKKK